MTVLEEAREQIKYWRDAYTRVHKELDAWQKWATTTDCLPRPLFEKRLSGYSDAIRQLVIAVGLLESISREFYRDEIAEMNKVIEHSMTGDEDV